MSEGSCDSQRGGEDCDGGIAFTRWYSTCGILPTCVVLVKEGSRRKEEGGGVETKRNRLVVTSYKLSSPRLVLYCSLSLSCSDM